MIAKRIKELAASYATDIIAIRHHLHAHPELSYKEFETSAFVRRQLDAYGIPWKILADTGVVGIMSPDTTGLLGLVSMIAPVITGGNTCIVIASESRPLPAVTFTEVLATSDLPGGVVNLLTGYRSELLKPLVAHMDINAVVVADATKEERTLLDAEATCNLKRVVYPKVNDWSSAEAQSPYFILDTQEVKTTWHPIERGQGGGGGY